MKTIVLGLGNTLLSDDGAGIFTARKVREAVGGAADVAEAETAGMDIIEILEGYDRAVIIDAVTLNGVEPGTVLKLKPNSFKTTPRLASFHDIDLVTALKLGERLGIKMPRDVIIYAVQGKDVVTLREGCLPEVEEVIPKLAGEIAGLVKDEEYSRVSVDIKRE